MSHPEQQKGQQTVQDTSGDGFADSISAIAIITIVVVAVVFWLKSMHG